METILTDSSYKSAINKIALLSSKLMLSTSEAEELNKLSKMAMAYEYRKYDFTLNNSYQNTVFQQSVIV